MTRMNMHSQHITNTEGTATGHCPSRTRLDRLAMAAFLPVLALTLIVAALAPQPAAADGPKIHGLSDGERAELMARFGATEEELETILRIMEEGRERNLILDHLTYLCEEIGPRLTGSSRLLRANKWTADLFREFGLKNVHLHEWGTIPVGFDRGPSFGRMVEPITRDFEFTARAWSAGTDGPVRGPVFREPMTQEEFDAISENLEGAWILRPATARRGVVRGVDPPGEFLPQMREAGIAGLITPSGDELVRTGGIRGWRNLSYDDLPTDVSVTIRRSDYDAINSRLFDGEDVVVEFDLDHTFVEGPVPVYNTVAEIPGTVWPDEVVIISGHLDSWDGPGSQGTVDNGTGSSVTIEAARILMAAGAQPKRTIRFILWTGEEQGLLGSRAYVAELSDEERAKISAVFVDDSGTNRQASLTCIEPMVPILQRGVEAINYAFPDMTVSLRTVERMPTRGASDHAAFNAVGIPGFFWGKTGRADYRYAWHTQNDRLDQAIPEYLIQNSTASALIAFSVANAETVLPRGDDEEEDDEPTEVTGE